MTDPLSHGYPDWGRQQATADIHVLDLDIVNIVAQTTYGPFLIAGMPYVFVRWFSAAAMHVAVEWYADAGLTVPLGNDILVTPAAAEGYVPLPARGSYARFVVQRGAYPGTISLQVAMTPAPFNSVGIGLGDNKLIEADGLNINAGATLTLNAGTVRGGLIHWDATLVLGVLYLVRLYSVDFAGGLDLLGVIDSNTGRGGGMLFAPALPLRMLFSNFDGTPKTAYAAVTFHPFSS